MQEWDDFFNFYLQEQVDREELYDSSDDIEISSPFDPRQVDIDSRTMVLANIVERLKYNEIVLDPDFQRKPDLWDNEKKSRLIESLLIKIPLPIFYFDMSEDENLIVVDGLQRLLAIRDFMALEEGDSRLLRLEGLEYLAELKGKNFYELPNNLKRRLREQTIQAYVIKDGTPDRVRNSIFERINTGGLPLTAAEIKNSVYRGKAAQLLKRMAESEEFVKATNGSIKNERMLDREFANRFLAFYLLGVENYKGSLEDYLNDVLVKVKNDIRIDDEMIMSIENDFKKSLVLAERLWGKSAFRKRIHGSEENYAKINKPLFEVITVQFAKLKKDEEQRLIMRSGEFLEKYDKLLDDENFFQSITNGTARVNSVTYRHKELRRIIIETIRGEKNA